MLQTEQINIRMDIPTKSGAEAIFKKLGLSSTDAVRMFYRQVIMQKGLPFQPKVPNAETLKAVKETKGKKGKKYKTAEALFDDLGI